MKVFRRLPSDADGSPYDSGWRFAVSVAAAILLLGLLACVGYVLTGV